MKSTEGFNKRLRNMICDIKDNMEHIRELDGDYKFRIIRKDIGENNLKCCLMLYELIIDTKFISLETKIYLSNRSMNYRNVSEELKFEYDITSSESNVASKIFYDKSKILKNLTETMIDELCASKLDVSEKYSDLLVKAIKNNKYVSLVNGIALDIKLSDKVSFDIDDKEFEKFLKVVEPYTMKKMREVENGINGDTLGYINYLMTSSNLTREDLDRLHKLQELVLGGLLGDLEV